jgi:hypothetical protein
LWLIFNDETLPAMIRDPLFEQAPLLVLWRVNGWVVS